MILIVEDDDSTREVLEYFLTDLNFKCVSMPCVDTAISWLSENTPRLLLIDFYLKNKTATEAIRYCQDRHPESAILLISAMQCEKLKGIAGDLGVQFLTKPFQLDRFEFIVKNSQNLLM